jgi:hypothetical protein
VFQVSLIDELDQLNKTLSVIASNQEREETKIYADLAVRNHGVGLHSGFSYLSDLETAISRALDADVTSVVITKHEDLEN